MAHDMLSGRTVICETICLSDFDTLCQVMKLVDPKPLVSEVVEVENDLPPLLSDEAPGEEEKCQFCGDNKNKPVRSPV